MALGVMAAGAISQGANAGCTRQKAEADRTDPDAPIPGIGTAVGLAIEIDNGAAVPLQLKQGQAFFLNQLDLRASVTATADEGVAGLAARGDFAALAWTGIAQADQDFVLLANPDGTFRRRRFFRGATWMNADSGFVLEQIDAASRPIGVPLFVSTGVEHERRGSDGFFDRRIRAIQWTNDCHGADDCREARAFEEEALVELRYALRPERTFTLAPQATALRLRWTLRSGQPYIIPISQIVAPPFGYGISVDVEPITPPRTDGSYAPGSDVTFRVTLK
ncbi:MAG TPA: hypothetical protein VH165_18935, partial [Kofleriaceae bacterium]|nr:hypothetical protein [Kofleriaceae bacterium]